MPKFFLFLSLYLLPVVAWSQNEDAPEREFRAAWVASVANIDWPSSRNLSVAQQKQEIMQLFDRLERNHFNAVIVQIRPVADAFYDSPFEPWSVYLTGKQGTAPSPFYDPLPFMIEEAHKRCLEFHAWLNPYRALMNAYKNPNPPNHITFTHPEWFVNYGTKKYFNPGLPEVKDYFLKIVKDIVSRYDIDAIHLDDYFYPYREGKTEFPDYTAYTKYNPKKLSRDDWRRDNVNTLVKELNGLIKKQKSYVKLGISPFGVWRNASVDPERGSRTQAGQTNYDDLFADILLWQKEGWIDYCLPQLYWETGHRLADYNTLIAWWDQNAFDRHMYVGHGVYRLHTPKFPWNNLDELRKQINLTRKFKNIQGSAFYSAKSFTQNIYNINSFFENEMYASPALLPEMPWLHLAKPTALKIEINYSTGNTKLIKWPKSKTENQQYAVYKIKNSRTTYRKELVALTTKNQFAITQAGDDEYGVVVLNRLHGASELSNLVR